MVSSLRPSPFAADETRGPPSGRQLVDPRPGIDLLSDHTTSGRPRIGVAVAAVATTTTTTEEASEAAATAAVAVLAVA